MTDVDRGAAFEIDEPRGRSRLLKWAIIAVAVLGLLGIGAGVWYFFLGGREHFVPKQQQATETPLPYFLELKPFVVSVASNGGVPHFLQLGVSLQLPASSAGEMVTSVLPQVQDAMRQTVLKFKSDELQTPEGIDKLRQAMTARLNETLAQVLGPDRVAKATGGKLDVRFVENIFFSTLIIE
jgi:flagellar basal body-associated protein FliL